MLIRLTRTTVLWTLEIAAVVVGVFALGCGFVIWRLHEGPIALDMLHDEFEAALARAFGADAVSLGAARLSWSGADRALLLTLEDVAAAGPEGPIIEAPRLEAGLQSWPLLRGEVVFSQLSATGGEISVLRAADGSVAIGLGDPARVRAEPLIVMQPQARLDIPGLVRRVLARAPALLRLVVTDAAINLADEERGLSARLEGATLVIERDAAGGIALAAQTDAPALGTGAFALARIEASPAIDAVRASASGRGVDLSTLAALWPASGLLTTHVEAVGDFDLVGTWTDADGLANLDGWLDLGPVRVRAGAADLEASAASLVARWDRAAGAVMLETLTIEGPDVAVRGTGRLDILAGAEPGAAWPLTLALSDLRVDVDPYFAEPLAAPRIELTGAFDPSARALGIERLDVATRGLEARFTGRLSLEAPPEAGAPPLGRLELDGPITGQASPADVLALWPTRLAEGARDWVAEAVSAGDLTEARLTLDVTTADIARQGLDNEALALDFGFTGGMVRVLPTLQPITDARGRGRLEGNRLTMTIDSARLLGLALSEGVVDIPRLNPRGAIGTFSARAEGPLQDALRFIDDPPMGYPSEFGAPPELFSGTGVLDVVVRRPMLSNVALEDLDFEVLGDFTGVAGPTASHRLPLTDADVTIRIDPTGLEARGRGKLGPAMSDIVWTENFRATDGAPSSRAEIQTTIDASVLDAAGFPVRTMLGGRIALGIEVVGSGKEVEVVRANADLTEARLGAALFGWNKLAGRPGAANLEMVRGPEDGWVVRRARIDAPDLDLEAGARFAADWRLLGADLRRLDAPGARDVAAALTRTPSGAFELTARGAEIDARAIIAQVFGPGEAGGLPAPVTMRAVFDRARVGDADRLEKVEVDLVHDGDRIDALRFRAEGPGGIYSADILTPEGGPEDGPRKLVARAPDAAFAARTAFGLDQIRGGVLTAAGVLPPGGAPSEITVVIERFTLVSAPALARVLSLASLRGLADALSGSGVAFDALDAPFTLYKGRLELAEARARGPALGLTVSGTIDLPAETLDLEGVIVPVYGVNSAFGGVPILGDLLTSREGEGVFGLTYTIAGPFAATRVFVNPLSALAPGFFRRIFEPAAPAAGEALAGEPSAEPPSPAPPNPDDSPM